jgi:hypothetical protein
MAVNQRTPKEEDQAIDAWLADKRRLKKDELIKNLPFTPKGEKIEAEVLPYFPPRGDAPDPFSDPPSPVVPAPSPVVPQTQKYGASGTTLEAIKGGALEGLGLTPAQLAAVNKFGGANFAPAVKLAQAFVQKPDPVNNWRVALDFFSTMAANMKPGVTALGAAGSAAKESLAYLRKRREAEKARKATLLPTAIAIMGARKPKTGDFKSFVTREGKTITLSLAELDAMPVEQRRDLVKFTKPGAGTATERARDFIIKVGPKIKDNTATPEEQKRYAIDYMNLLRGKQTTEVVDGKTVTRNEPGIELSIIEGLPIPDDLDASKIISAKSREWGASGTNATYTQRMLFQEGIVREVMSGGYIPDARSTLADEMPKFIGTALLTNEGQRFYAASRNFIAAVLRKESGAAISDTEYLNGLKQYFPQVGDAAGVMADKEALRSAAITGMYRESGDAFDSIYPDAVKFMKTTVGDKTFDIINPRSYSEYQLTKVKQGRSLYADAVIESLDLEALSSLIAKKDFQKRYSKKQQKRIADRAKELKGAKK